MLSAPSRWDIVRLPFPYTNRPVQQRRPALVVALPDTGDGPALLWVLMITSAENRRWPGDVPVTDRLQAGLPAPSIVRCAKIATVDASAAERVGVLPEADRAMVEARLGALIPSPP